MAWYGWIGAFVLVINQALLPWQIPVLARWFTPVMWTAYILLVDALVRRREGRSLLGDRPREALLMATVSIPLWLLFEGYNVRLRNWAYFGVPEDPWVAAIAYAWAFATIWPALFETAALLGAGPLPWPAAARPPVPSSPSLRLAIAVGLAFVVAPAFVPLWIVYALVEERGLRRRFGDDYDAYRREVGLLPWLGRRSDG